MIIICTNTGHLRAFRVTQSETAADEHGQISEISDEEIEGAVRRVGDRATDQAGRFRSDGSPGMASGEANGSELEEERRLIARVAEKVGRLVNEEKADYWRLAAPGPINSRLVAELDPAVRERMVGNEKSDLTKLPTLEVGRKLGVIK